MKKNRMNNPAQSPSILRSINPATLEPVGEVMMTSPSHVEEMVQKASDAFPAWRDKGISERSKIFKHCQQLLLDRTDEFAELITLEMGRPLAESMALELNGSIDLIGYYSKRAFKFLNDRRVPLHHLLFKRRKSTVHFEPLGVLGIISPWNWPLLIPLGGIIPALLSGNAVLFKHSELTPLMAVKIRELLLDAGVPDSIFQIVQGGADQGKALVNSHVEKIFFTGSTEVGQQLLQQASRTLKKSVLEMGGNDPAIVGGFAIFKSIKTMLIGNQKGKGLKERLERNFGMPHPEGYRKAVRLMKISERFGLPLITMVDTPGAYPGVEAEERGQSESSAKSMLTMSSLKTPIVSVIIGEGGSGGALALAVADRVIVMENANFSVVSPEGCASILWKDRKMKKKAAEALSVLRKVSTASVLTRPGEIAFTFT